MRSDLGRTSIASVRHRIDIDRWPLSRRLVLLVLGIAVPLLVLLALAVYQLSQTGFVRQRESLTYTASSLAAAVDRELETWLVLGRTLSRSPALLADDLAAFEAEARRAFPSVTDASVLVADTDGQQLLNLVQPSGQPLPRRAPEGIDAQQQAFATRTSVVSGIRNGALPRDWLVTLDFPVFKNDQPYRALAVSIRATRFLSLLNARQLPPGWLTGILDRNGLFVARVPNHDQWVGKPASAGFRASMHADGIFEFRSLEGDEIIQANAHSSLSGWAIGVAAKRQILVEAAWRSLAGSLLPGAVILTLLTAFALVTARRITQGLAEVREKMQARLAGVPTTELVTGMPELAALWDGLRQAIAARDAARAAQRTSDIRLATLAQLAPAIVWSAPPHGAADYANDRWYSFTGAPRDKPPSEVFFDVLHPDDRERTMRSWEEAQARGDDTYEIELQLRSADGSYRWFLTRAQRIREPDGSALGWIGVSTDISERKAFEAQLQTSEERLRLANDAARTMIFDTDLTLGRSSTYGLSNILGEPDGNLGDDAIAAWHGRIHPDDRLAHRAIVDAHRHGGHYTSEYRIRHADGRWIWVHDDTEVMVDADGAPRRIIGSIRDISRRKADEAHIHLLMREVNHRSKNMLSVVQAIARSTASGARNTADFLAHFTERLHALAAVQDLLTDNHWESVDLEALVRKQLAPYAELLGSRIALAGNPTELSPTAAQSLGMALHELATNAAKYGALSSETGSISIAWEVDDQANPPRFTMRWIETAGREIAPPQRTGFGTRVICEFLKARLDGEVSLDFTASGLRWQLTCPLTGIVPQPLADGGEAATLGMVH